MTKALTNWTHLSSRPVKKRHDVVSAWQNEAHTCWPHVLGWRADVHPALLAVLRGGAYPSVQKLLLQRRRWPRRPTRCTGAHMLGG